MGALALVWRRRPVAVLAVGVALVLASMSRHVLGVSFPRLAEPAMIVVGLVVVAWCALAALGRARRLGRLGGEAHHLALASAAFRARVEAWLVGAAGGELEAEALRGALLARHAELVAAVDARLRGGGSSGGVADARRGVGEGPGEAVDQLVALQREALAEAALLGFLGDARMLALDDALVALSSARPVEVVPEARWAGSLREAFCGAEDTTTRAVERAMAAITAIYAVLLLLGGAQRLAVVAAGAVAAVALLVFEAWATRPLTTADDPRVPALRTR